VVGLVKRLIFRLSVREIPQLRYMQIAAIAVYQNQSQYTKVNQGITVRDNSKLGESLIKREEIITLHV